MHVTTGWDYLSAMCPEQHTFGKMTPNIEHSANDSIFLKEFGLRIKVLFLGGWPSLNACFLMEGWNKLCGPTTWNHCIIAGHPSGKLQDVCGKRAASFVFCFSFCVQTWETRFQHSGTHCCCSVGLWDACLGNRIVTKLLLRWASYRVLAPYSSAW